MNSAKSLLLLYFITIFRNERLGRIDTAQAI